MSILGDIGEVLERRHREVQERLQWEIENYPLPAIGPVHTSLMETV